LGSTWIQRRWNAPGAILALLATEFSCTRVTMEMWLRSWPARDPRVRGILLDLGASFEQLVSPQRGFSIRAPGPLDMRFSPAAR